MTCHAVGGFVTLADLQGATETRESTVSNDVTANGLPESLPDEPMRWLQRWIEDATSNKVQRNPNAMTLATVDAEGRPSARVVLCKSIDIDCGYVVFYTNFESRKCLDIATNPNVALAFHWDSLGLQARVEGPAVRSPAAESDAYFASRNRGSQLGAWGSDQSRPVESRDALLAQINARNEQHRDAGRPVPRPPHWGGVRVWAAAIELWVEGADRVHDRARWERMLSTTESGSDAFDASPWIGRRLQP